jgi:hypothetical protein
MRGATRIGMAVLSRGAAGNARPTVFDMFRNVRM